eukprot:TRINITY_DN3210_c0_g1_i1.p1 TRINITY_DN3210_c0_g1~~TRINITY_DN3210_c0_g1_i1.p1  ORF type:complete len:347 (+),score=85.14 TRINITY_DN3210_c0_g1_i1:181-1221(+)
MDIEKLNREELIALVEDLNLKLRKSQQKNRQLETQINELRSSQIEQQKQVEAEEEYIANKLFKRLEEINNEKSAMILQLEREEEYLTNTLQKKLAELQKEKVQLESHLEMEEEYIVNKLQKQMQELTEAKEELEHRLEEETPASIELRKVKAEFEEHRRKKEREISKLKSENFVLDQQLKKFKDQNTSLSEEKLEFERGAEIDEEFKFNLSKKLGGASPPRPPKAYELMPRKPRSSSISRSPRPALGSSKLKCLHRGWLKVKKDDVDQDESYFTLLSERLIGYPTDVGEIPEVDSLYDIDLDLIKSFTHNQSCFNIVLKSGESYHFSSADPLDKWIELLKELTPTQ